MKLLIVFAVVSTVLCKDTEMKDISIYDDGNGKCTTYIYYTGTRFNYDGAREYCQEKSSSWDLAVIDTLEKYNHVRRTLAEWVPRKSNSPYKGFWVGFDDQNVEGSLHWLNGALESYDKWAVGQPNNNAKQREEGQDCVQIWPERQRGNFLKFDDNYCNKRREFICSTSIMLLILFACISTANSMAHFKESSIFDDNNGECTTYIYIIEPRLNYKDAQEFCLAQSGVWNLAIVDTVDKYKHVRDKMKSFVPRNSDSPYKGFWVGFDDKAAEGDFHWLNGEGQFYNRWADGQPNNNVQVDSDGQDCVQIWVSKQKNQYLFYDDNNCSRSREFICSMTYSC